MSGFRVIAAFFSFITMVMTAVLIPVAYFGDKNPTWAWRVAVVGFVAALIFLVSLFWW